MLAAKAFSLNSLSSAGAAAPAEEGRNPVDRSIDYRRQAAECRVLARKAQNDEQRSQLLVLAETWESLAADREAKLAKTALTGSA